MDWLLKLITPGTTQPTWEFRNLYKKKVRLRTTQAHHKHNTKQLAQSDSWPHQIQELETGSGYSIKHRSLTISGTFSLVPLNKIPQKISRRSPYLLSTLPRWEEMWYPTLKYSITEIDNAGEVARNMEFKYIYMMKPSIKNDTSTTQSTLIINWVIHGLIKIKN